ncbi:MAG: diguanylate cyclase [Rhodospirillales bacterium]|nr:MAG: diguanylate cyclase [Rhodospirillales bacterium]
MTIRALVAARVSVQEEIMTGNGGAPGDEARSRDISVSIADALDEHQRWLEALRRDLICRLKPDGAFSIEDAHTQCRFGRWFDRHRRSGILEGDMFVRLDRAHQEVHEAARYLAGKAASEERIPADEYDALIGVFEDFRKLAARVAEDYGRPEDVKVAEDEAIAELQGRMTMLAELERESERADRTNTPMCLVMVRPNDLLEVEAKFGDLGIDRVVAGLAARLYANLRPYDAVYRYGRSEFLICLPGTDVPQACAVTKRLSEAVDGAPFVLSESVETGISARFGIARTDARTTVQQILDRASRAANMAGTAAGERIMVWSAEVEN